MCSQLADCTQFDAFKSRGSGPRARFAANGRSQCSDTLPIWLVAVSGVVFAVRRGFAVHTKRYEVLRPIVNCYVAGRKRRRNKLVLC